MDPRLILGAAAIGIAAVAGKKKPGGKRRSDQSRSPDATLLNPMQAMKSTKLPEKEWPEMVFNIPFAAGDPRTRWPLVTNHSKKWTISYRTVRGDIIGNGARRFMAKRGEKYHVGIDLYCSHGDPVIAMEDGQIVNIYHFFHGAYCLIVQCDSGLVINYGEVANKSWKEFGLEKGSRIKKGQGIARIGTMSGGSSMLHFETYMPPTKNNKRFKGGDTGPILNPTYYLLRTRAIEASGGKTFSATDCLADGTLASHLVPKELQPVAEQDIAAREAPADAVTTELLVDDQWRPKPDQADGP